MTIEVAIIGAGFAGRMPTATTSTRTRTCRHGRPQHSNRPSAAALSTPRLQLRPRRGYPTPTGPAGLSQAGWAVLRPPPD